MRSRHQELPWPQLHVPHSLSVPAAIPNFQPSFNICSTDPADTIVPSDGARELVNMRWVSCPPGGVSQGERNLNLAISGIPFAIAY